MTPPRRRRPRASLGLAALLPLALAGCATCFNPVAPPTREERTACAQIPQPCRNHVYVFFLHGMDPLDFANLCGLRDYVQELGFIKTYFGELYHTHYFAEEIRKIHRDDPEARFVLIGFSFGANSARDVAQDVKKDDIPIDLLVYLGGNTLTNDPVNRPENAVRIYNVLATGYIWNGDTLDGAENINYTGVWHFGSPTHPGTLEFLVRELTELAGRVPFAQPAHAPPPEEAPTPRPLMPRASAKRDEWDFLLPSETIPAPPTAPKPPAAPPEPAKPPDPTRAALAK